MSMCEAKKKNNKSCILNEKGRKKLNDALKKKYPNNDYNYQDLAYETGIDREVISEIINNKNKSSLRKKLDDLFVFLNIDLEKDDYYNPLSKKTDKQPQINIDIPLSHEEIIKQALKELNYDDQKNDFKNNIINIKPAVAFVVHGNPGYGQKWLVNCLSYNIPYHVNAWKYCIHVKPHRKDINSLLTSLAGTLNTNSSHQEIQDKIYDLWKNSTVILAIHNVDVIANNCLEEFIKKCWLPLVERVNIANNNSKYRIVLFLVDHKNYKSKLETILSSESLNNNNHLPIFLPDIKDFDTNLVEYWVDTQDKILSQLQWNEEESMEQIMKDIVQRDSKPIDFFKSICDCFDLKWQNIEETLSL